ncbi:MAG: LCP family protein [Ethanoligenens sp.]
MKKPQGYRNRLRQLLPWLIMSAAALVLLGGLGLYALLYQPAQPTAKSLEVVPSDTFNILLMLDAPDSHAPLAFLLIGLDATDKQLTVMPLPSALATGGGSTLSGIFNKSGPTDTAAACSALLGVPVDYHWTQDTTTFAQVVDLFGGVDCDLPVAASARVPHGAQVQAVAGPQHLNGVKVEAVACYADYAKQMDRLNAQGTVLQALLQQKCNAQNLDPNVFGNLFDLAQTNFSMNDLLSKGRALEQAASPSGHVNVLLPVLRNGPNATYSLSPTNTARVVKAFGKQNRRYLP